MARYIVTVHRHDGRQLSQLGPVEFMSTARQEMLRHAGLTYLPSQEPATRSDVLEVWVIGDRQYRIKLERQVLAPSVQRIRLIA